jgi:hypothetical protein
MTLTSELMTTYAWPVPVQFLNGSGEMSDDWDAPDGREPSHRSIRSRTFAFGRGGVRKLERSVVRCTDPHGSGAIPSHTECSTQAYQVLNPGVPTALPSRTGRSPTCTKWVHLATKRVTHAWGTMSPSEPRSLPTWGNLTTQARVMHLHREGFVAASDPIALSPWGDRVGHAMPLCLCSDDLFPGR